MLYNVDVEVVWSVRLGRWRHVIALLLFLVALGYIVYTLVTLNRAVRKKLLSENSPSINTNTTPSVNHKKLSLPKGCVVVNTGDIVASS